MLLLKCQGVVFLACFVHLMVLPSDDAVDLWSHRVAFRPIFLQEMTSSVLLLQSCVVLAEHCLNMVAKREQLVGLSFVIAVMVVATPQAGWLLKLNSVDRWRC